MLLQLFGLLLPPVIDLINKRYSGDSHSQIRFLYSFGVCILVGVFVDFLGSNATYTLPLLDLSERIASSVLGVFALSQLSYQVAYKDSAMRAAIAPKLMD